MKRLAGIAATAFAKSGLLGLLEARDHDAARVRVVAYHRVDDLKNEPDLDPGLVSATPAEFREQAEIIARHYNAISLDDLVAAHRGEKTLPERAMLFTFDDGYLDFAEHAWPTLRALGIPAVLFVPTAFPDSPSPGFWWDRLHAALRATKENQIQTDEVGTLPLGNADERRAAHRAIRNHVKSLEHKTAMPWLDAILEQLANIPSVHRVLGWDALRGLAADGVDVCSHGHSHALMTRLAPDDRADDLSTSKRMIEEQLGAHAPAPAFAYPASANDDASRRAVADAGYTLGFGGGRQIDTLPLGDARHVMRLPMLRYATDLFRAQLRPSVAGLGRLLID